MVGGRYYVYDIKPRRGLWDAFKNQSDKVMHAGCRARDRRRKRVSEVAVDTRDVARTNDIKYGLRHGGRSPELAPAGGFFPRSVRLVKQGLPVLRGQAGLRASSSGKWLTAYIYQPPPTLCHPYARTQIVSLTGYLRAPRTTPALS